MILTSTIFGSSGPGPYKFFAGRLFRPDWLSSARVYAFFRLNTDTQKLDAIDLPVFFYSIIPYDDRDVLPQPLLDTTSYVDLEARGLLHLRLVGTPWSYDPNVSRSNRDGQESGPYVLNLSLSPATRPRTESPLAGYGQPPPSEPEPTDSEGDDDGGPGSWYDPDRPPGHGAPLAQQAPATGVGFPSPAQLRREMTRLPVGGARPPGGGGSTYTLSGRREAEARPIRLCHLEDRTHRARLTQPVTPPRQDTPTTGTRPPVGDFNLHTSAAVGVGSAS